MGEVIAEHGKLIGLCAWNGSEWVKIAADDNDFLKVAIAAQLAVLEVEQDTPGDLLVGQHQYNGSAWHKSNLLWGYNERFNQKVVGDIGGSGYVTLNMTAVGEGYVYIIQAISWRNTEGATTSNELSAITADTSWIFLATDDGHGARVIGVWDGELCLKEGDYISLLTYGTSGHNNELCVWGYKMKIDM